MLDANPISISNGKLSVLLAILAVQREGSKLCLITISLTHFESDDKMLFLSVYYILPKGFSFVEECWSDLNMLVGPVGFGQKNAGIERCFNLEQLSDSTISF